MSPSDFPFVPTTVNETAPGGACVLRTFEDVSAFILTNVADGHRIAPHWAAVRQDIHQARFGARRAEVHEAMRHALAVEGWLGRYPFQI
jgi:hypothetical protein